MLGTSVTQIYAYHSYDTFYNTKNIPSNDIYIPLHDITEHLYGPHVERTDLSCIQTVDHNYS